MHTLLWVNDSAFSSYLEHTSVCSYKFNSLYRMLSLCEGLVF